MAGEAKQVSAVDIKQLWHTNPENITGDVTGAMVRTLLQTALEVKNVHQDTWQLEEAEPSQDSYKNQLTGSVYRMGAKQMGEVTANFTIGRYDYATKAALIGGTATGTSWKRARGLTDIKKCIIALTQDDQYVVFPYMNITARESNADKAIGIAVKGTMLEPINVNVSPEYWFDASEVVVSGNND